MSSHLGKFAVRYVLSIVDLAAVTGAIMGASYLVVAAADKLFREKKNVQ